MKTLSRLKFLVLILTAAIAAPAFASELESVKDEIEVNEAEQNAVEDEIENYEEQIAVLADEIHALEDELDREYELMQLRIQAFYENYENGFIEEIVQSGSLSGIITDVQISIDLTSYDRSRLDEIAQMTEDLVALQNNMLELLDEAYLEKEKLIEEHENLEEEYEEIKSQSDDLDLLAALIYCEAGGEIYNGKVAVACVVINRVNSSSYPDTISGVIYQSGQFSPASSGRLATVLANSLATDSCYEAAEYVLSGNNPYPTFLSFRASYVSVSCNYTLIGNQKFW